MKRNARRATTASPGGDSVLRERHDEFKVFFNLHDVFLNASLQHNRMVKSPIDPDVRTFHASDRIRFERCWVMFLYVLVEAWRSPFSGVARRYIASVASVAELEALLDEGERLGHLAKMRETRDYMCHRDRRDYWDEGRLAVCGQLDFHERLYAAFSNVMLKAMIATNSGDTALPANVDRAG